MFYGPGLKQSTSTNLIVSRFKEQARLMGLTKTEARLPLADRLVHASYSEHAGFIHFLSRICGQYIQHRPTQPNRLHTPLSSASPENASSSRSHASSRDPSSSPLNSSGFLLRFLFPIVFFCIQSPPSISFLSFPQASRSFSTALNYVSTNPPCYEI